MTEHNKYYWETDRNMPTPVNPKMKISKEELGLKDSSIRIFNTPEYYKGKNGYEARKVVENFDLNYNVGTAVTYLLRATRKHDTPIDCIKKALDHLEFELERLDNEETNI